MTDLKEDGRVPDGTGLSSTTEPASSLGPSGFDPSRIDPHAIGLARPGEFVRFIGYNGYPGELDRALYRFTLDEVLMVEETRIGGWRSEYRFLGGMALWNTVMFAPCDSDTRRMAATGTGSVRSTSSAGRQASPDTSPKDQSHG